MAQPTSSSSRVLQRLPKFLLATIILTVWLASPLAGPPRPAIFREAARAVGLNFQHFTGATGEFYFPENMGPGLALIDYDNDGDLDVYLLQGKLLDEHKHLSDAVFPPADPKLQNRLFRNNLVETGKLSFVDVTAKAGVGSVGYGMGAAVGDYDNDGNLDLYVTNFGPNLLYHNNGNGTFTDVTATAGVIDGRWSTSAAFLDYDLDGDLDLFVTTYVDFTVKGNRACHSPLGMRDYCNPSVYRPLPSRLFRNDGNGRFKDVTEAAGLGRSFGAGLGVVCTDFDGDGWTDIFVANDGNPNQLWLNKRTGAFEDIGLISGTAYSVDGKAQAGMGVTAGDFDGDGDSDLFITHLSTETHTLYQNDGRANFVDVTTAFGLSSIRTFTGFGTYWFDYDNDGHLDLFMANGAVYVIETLRGEPYPYHEKNQLFHNDGTGHYSETSLLGGPALQLSEVSRGAAFGDIDNDGDIDIVVANNNGPTRLLLNQAGSHNHWLKIRLVGVHTNREGIGAKVGLFRANHPALWRHAHRDGSYLSSSDVTIHFGLGQNPRIEALVVQWPNGRSESWKGIRPDRLITLQEGSGTPRVLPSSKASS